MRKKLWLFIALLILLASACTIVVMAMDINSAEVGDQISLIQSYDAQIIKKKALMSNEDFTIKERKAAKEEAREIMEQREDAVAEYYTIIEEPSIEAGWKPPYTEEEYAAIRVELDTARQEYMAAVEEMGKCMVRSLNNPENEEYAAEYELKKLRTEELQQAYVALLEKYGRN